MEGPKKSWGFHTPAIIAKQMRIKVVSVQKLRIWLEDYLKQNPLGQPVKSVLCALEQKRANIIEILECISIDVFSNIPSKIPAWRLSQEKLSRGAKLLEDAAQLLEEICDLDSPVFRDRGAEVPYSYRYPDLVLEIRAAAKGLRQLKPIGHRPDLVKVNECTVSLCDLLIKQTGKPCQKGLFQFHDFSFACSNSLREQRCEIRDSEIAAIGHKLNEYVHNCSLD